MQVTFSNTVSLNSHTIIIVLAATLILLIAIFIYEIKTKRVWRDGYDTDDQQIEPCFILYPETPDGQAFLESIAEDIIEQRQPDITVTIYTKYYPPTRLDPPEWDDEERTVEYCDLPDSVQDDLQERVVEALTDMLDQQLFNSKDECKAYLLEQFTDDDWNNVVRAWDSFNNDRVQEKAQEEFDNYEPDYD